MTTTSKSVGIYSALDPNSRQVRFVSLRPGGWSDHIECHLEQADLDLVPKFEALSYTWGPSTENQSILLNGTEVIVTDNLYYALRRLRLLHDHRTLWIDQLSINQDDIDERGQQVGLMNIIYGKAAYVTLWVGEETQLSSCSPPVPFPIQRTRPGAWVLGPFPDNEIGDYCRFKADPIHATGIENCDDAPNEPDYIYHAFRLVASLARMNVHLPDQPYFTPNSRDNEKKPQFNENVFRTLDFLMRRPWWTRMWTLQECVLPDHATVTYGPTAAPLSIFVWASRFFMQHSGTCCVNFHKQLLPKWQTDILDHFCLTLANIYRPMNMKQRRWSNELEPTLRLSRNRQATDARDKVYGLLGLSLKWHDKNPIIPNYRLAAPQIYQATTLKLIQMTETLSVLGDCIHNNDSSYPDLPSWVVKWNIPETFRSPGMFLYRASGDANAASTRMVGDTVLCLLGFKVDTILRVGRAMDFTKSPQEISDVFQSWKDLAAESTVYAVTPLDAPPPIDDKPSKTSSSNSTSLGWRDAFWRTLCGDTYFVPGPRSDSGLAIRRAEPSDHVAFTAWCNQMEPALAEHAAISRSIGGPVTPNAEPQARDISAMMDMSIRNASARQRMFMTDRGYIGLAPSRVKEGDHIFILHGGSGPFLLRDAGVEELEGVPPGYQRYVLLGMCYVHGIMDGEAMHWKLQKDNVYLV